MLLGAIALVCVARHPFVHRAVAKSIHVAMPFNQSVSAFILQHCKYHVINKLILDNVCKKNCKSKGFPGSFCLI